MLINNARIYYVIRISYKLRVNLSAGGLYPTEVYVQTRSVEGIIVENNCLTLICELGDDG
jgi:hypothetical protein